MIISTGRINIDAIGTASLLGEVLQFMKATGKWPDKPYTVLDFIKSWVGFFFDEVDYQKWMKDKSG